MHLPSNTGQGTGALKIYNKKDKVARLIMTVLATFERQLQEDAARTGKVLPRSRPVSMDWHQPTPLVPWAEGMGNRKSGKRGLTSQTTESRSGCSCIVDYLWQEAAGRETRHTNGRKAHRSGVWQQLHPDSVRLRCGHSHRTNSEKRCHGVIFQHLSDRPSIAAVEYERVLFILCGLASRCQRHREVLA